MTVIVRTAAGVMTAVRGRRALGRVARGMRGTAPAIAEIPQLTAAHIGYGAKTGVGRIALLH
jgi:hypothetical protein